MTKTFDIDEVRARLLDGIKANGFTMRSASEAAGFNPGFVHSITGDGREPTIGNLAKLCESTDLSLSYVLYGFTMTPEVERLILLLEKNPEKLQGILTLLK